ncbi:magnesium-translocating P-type ATPase [Rhodopseudomonas sp.]|uniref:magnesium-translocating P-type ATPase n=1 Tax=Rhodopseudomonas sp. TaxID=1078 RepID=UPI0025FBAE70|nr:magnesium-translocating P-type ATPase [Rhodopseudomonas sp.]
MEEKFSFWLQPTDALLADLHSRREGLSVSDAAARIKQYGPNAFHAAIKQSLLSKIGKRILNPLIAILLVAAAISSISGDLGSFVIILTVITISITLDIVQEHHAEVAVETLRRSVAVKADVRRGGALVAVPVEDIVPGDIIELRTGDLVPADGIILDAHNLQVNESLMTGEAFPSAKSEAPCSNPAPSDATNALFAGTSVVGGNALMLVVATGQRTRFGGIAIALSAAEPETALEKGVHSLGVLILKLTVFLTLFVLFAHLVAGRPPIDSFLFAVALAVGLTPELLPMVMTVTLARGALRMAEKKVIVKRLSSIHDLGAMDVLCTDKTGTLTQAVVTLVEHIGIDGQSSDRLLMLAALNSKFETGVRSPLDVAILAHPDQPPTDAWIRRGEVPFDFERRCVSVLAGNGNDSWLITKGAPEAILSRAIAIEGKDGKPLPLDAAARAALDALQNKQVTQGFRLLALAVKPMPAGTTEVSLTDETDLTLVGFCVFSDPPKLDAAAAIATLQGLGVRLKVISGDHAEVVRHVATAVGLNGDRLLSGDEISDLTETALAARIENVDLFARVDPDQKTRIIKALQRRGHVVGFMGDGINDAPAIRAAHVGLSVEGATDIARAAADMIMLAPDLGVLAEGVKEGRRTFANILKYVRMGTSSNFGNMLSMALASIVLPFLPLLPMQILLNNLLYDLSEIGIPFDSVDADDVDHPHTWDIKSILRFTIVMGAVSSLFDIATFTILLKVFNADAATFQTAWFLESIATQILVIFLIRSRGHFWSSRPHWILVATSLGALGFTVALVLSPLRKIFGFVTIEAQLGLSICAIVALYLVCAEIAKRLAMARLRA